MPSLRAGPLAQSRRAPRASRFAPAGGRMYPPARLLVGAERPSGHVPKKQQQQPAGGSKKAEQNKKEKIVEARLAGRGLQFLAAPGGLFRPWGRACGPLIPRGRNAGRRCKWEPGV